MCLYNHQRGHPTLFLLISSCSFSLWLYVGSWVCVLEVKWIWEEMCLKVNLAKEKRFWWDHFTNAGRRQWAGRWAQGRIRYQDPFSATALSERGLKWAGTAASAQTPVQGWQEMAPLVGQKACPSHCKSLARHISNEAWDFLLKTSSCLNFLTWEG